MNFFAEQRKALSHSKRLVFLFSLAVATIVVAVSAVLTGVWVFFLQDERNFEMPSTGSIVTVAIISGLITLSFIAIASMVKTRQLRAGGGVVARKLGGTLIPPDTTNPSYRRLRNVVEEISIASGVPVPEIYVMEQESGINAFAAGYTPSDAAVAVTQGCLKHLNRAELQAVIAHEFSHILNGDMRLNIRLMGLLFGILVLAIVARGALHLGRGGRDSKGAGPILLAALAVMIVGYVGVFFGRLIKAGLSRQREYLADASAVQFTRDNVGVSGALKKIAALSEGSKLTTADGEEVSHMLFGDGVGYSKMFATHPPLMDRIKRVQPDFRPEEIKEIARSLQRKRDVIDESEDRAELAKARRDFPGGLGSLPGSEALPGGAAGAVLGGVILAGAGAVGSGAGAGTAPTASAEGAKPAAQKPDTTVSEVGNPGMEHFQYAELLRADLPERLADAAHMQDHAIDLVLAVLVDSNGGDAEAQLQLIADRRGDDARAAVEALLPEFEKLHPAQRGPLLAIAFPALKRRPRSRLEEFLGLVDELIHLDGEVSVFEYALAMDLTAHVIEALDPSKARIFGRSNLPSVQDEAARVLAVLAMLGHDDADEARRAYLKGLHTLLPRAAIAYQPPANWVDTLDECLPKLDRLDPAAKELFLEALVVTMRHDGQITLEEGEVLRAVCACLHCPMPPLLPDRG